MVNDCIKDFKKEYIGKYVLVKSNSDRTVICYHKKLTKALKKSQSLGYESPLIIYNPKKYTGVFLGSFIKK